MPSSLRRRLTASAWSRVSPATNRVASRLAADEVSIHLRNCFWRERKRKKLRTNSSLAPRARLPNGKTALLDFQLGTEDTEQQKTSTVSTLLQSRYRAIASA